jgi:hypothetical protein
MLTMNCLAEEQWIGSRGHQTYGFIHSSSTDYICVAMLVSNVEQQYLGSAAVSIAEDVAYMVCDTAIMSDVVVCCFDPTFADLKHY